MIITLLYSGKKVIKDGIAADILVEVLHNARMMGIADMEEEIKAHIISNLVDRSTFKLFKVLNLAMEHRFS